MWKQLFQQLINGDQKVLARCVSMVENEVEGYEELLEQLPVNNTVKIIGITGPPGAGKSTLADALINELIKDEKKIAVLCVDPSSPFNFGSLLGDRIRMNGWYNNPNVFIRSLATRGSLGGLHPKIIEISDVVKAAGFEYIIIETVGVGQSEVEIASLADVTIVVLVPEAGDVIQTMKAGLMEIADIFVVNKSDRPGGEIFINNLKKMLALSIKNDSKTAIVKTIATEKKGIEKLYQEIIKYNKKETAQRKYAILAEKAWHLIQNKKMKNINKDELLNLLKKETEINIYQFIKKY